jgi:archaellum biogenesis protein FlaJ (TadC family)
MFFPVSDWFLAFVITVVLEAAVVLFLLRRAEPDVLRLGLLVVFANLATHPVVWYVITQLLLVGTPGYVLVAETWAIAAEAVFFVVAIRGLSMRRAIVVAVAANAMSFLVGRLIGGLWPDLIR